MRYEKQNVKYGLFTDVRDGREYSTIQIGDQLWMAENLRYNPNRKKKGDAFWESWKSRFQFEFEESFVMMNFDFWTLQEYMDSNNSSVVSDLSRGFADRDFLFQFSRAVEGFHLVGYYSWEMAEQCCPKGWHLPSVEEWEKLFAFIAEKKKLFNHHRRSWTDWRTGRNVDGRHDLLGGSLVADDELLFKPMWRGDYYDAHVYACGEDLVHFGALPFGSSSCDKFGWDLWKLGAKACFWTADKSDSDTPIGVELSPNRCQRRFWTDKEKVVSRGESKFVVLPPLCLLNVRCIKDR